MVKKAPTVATTDRTERDRLTVYIPPGLRRAVKIAAAVEGVSMSKWVTRAFNSALPAFELPPATPPAS